MPNEQIKMLMESTLFQLYNIFYPYKNPIDNATTFNVQTMQGELKAYLLSEVYQTLIETLRTKVDLCLVPITAQSTWTDFRDQCVDDNVFYLVCVADDNDPGPTFFDYKYPDKKLKKEPFFDLSVMEAKAKPFKNNPELCQRLLADHLCQMKDCYRLEDELLSHEKKQTLEEITKGVHEYNATWGELLPLTVKLETKKGRTMINLKITYLEFGYEAFERQTRKAGATINLDISNIPDGEKDNTIIISKIPTPAKPEITPLTTCGLFGVGIAGLALATTLYSTRQINP